MCNYFLIWTIYKIGKTSRGRTKEKKSRRNRKFFWKLRCPNLATKKRRKIFEAILLCVSHTIILEIDKKKVFYNSLETPIHYHICVPLPFRENKKCIYCYWTLTHFNTIYNSLLYRCFFFLLLCFPFIHSFQSFWLKFGVSILKNIYNYFFFQITTEIKII